MSPRTDRARALRSSQWLLDLAGLCKMGWLVHWARIILLWCSCASLRAWAGSLLPLFSYLRLPSPHSFQAPSPSLPQSYQLRPDSATSFGQESLTHWYLHYFQLRIRFLLNWETVRIASYMFNLFNLEVCRLETPVQKSFLIVFNHRAPLRGIRAS